MKQPTLFDSTRTEQIRRAKKRIRKAIETRNAGYYQIRNEEDQPGGLGKRQQQVYDFIKSRPDGVSNSEIASALGWSINRVTPRTVELREKGYVVGGPRRECTVTHSIVQTWRTA